MTWQRWRRWQHFKTHKKQSVVHKIFSDDAQMKRRRSVCCNWHQPLNSYDWRKFIDSGCGKDLFYTVTDSDSKLISRCTSWCNKGDFLKHGQSGRGLSFQTPGQWNDWCAKYHLQETTVKASGFLRAGWLRSKRLQSRKNSLDFFKPDKWSSTNSHVFCRAVSWKYGLLKISQVCFGNNELLKTSGGPNQCIGQLISSNLQTKSFWTDGFEREMSAWIWSRSGAIKNW